VLLAGRHGRLPRLHHLRHLSLSTRGRCAGLTDALSGTLFILSTALTGLLSAAGLGLSGLLRTIRTLRLPAIAPAIRLGSARPCKTTEGNQTHRQRDTVFHLFISRNVIGRMLPGPDLVRHENETGPGCGAHTDCRSGAHRVLCADG
jgi:hypothetical protein